MPGDWSGTSPYSPLSQVEQLIALMDTLGIDKAVLVGSSAGGITAALTAVYYPERVKALILVDAAIFQGAPPRWLSPILRIPQVKRLGFLVIRFYYTHFFDYAHKRAWHDPSKRTPAILDGYRKPLQCRNWDRALWEYVFAYEPLNLGDRLDEIEMPALIIAGDDDRIVPQRGSERIADQIAHAELAVIPDTGHLPHEENLRTIFRRGKYPFLRRSYEATWGTCGPFCRYGTCLTIDEGDGYGLYNRSSKGRNYNT